MEQNNTIEISGVITSNFEFDYEKYGEKFYTLKMESQRASGVIDEVILSVSDKYIIIDEDLTGQYGYVMGEIRTHNYKDENGVHLKIVIFVNILDILDVDLEERIDTNIVNLNGYLCKKGSVRTTPLDRRILDSVIAVNRNYNKNNYIPCIFWGKNAKRVSEMDIGDNVIVSGRLQSRKYSKQIGDKTETRTAYEVSVQSVE